MRRMHAPLGLLPARKPLQNAAMWGVLPLESVVQVGGQAVAISSVLY
jgi:hypothetical protein